MIKKVVIILLIVVIFLSCAYGYFTYIDCEMLLLTEKQDNTYLFQFKWFGIMEITKGELVYDTPYGGRPIYKVQKPTSIVSYEKEGNTTNKFKKKYCILNYRQIQDIRKNILKLQEEKDKLIPEERWDVDGGWLVKANLSGEEYYSIVWDHKNLSSISEDDEFNHLFYNPNLLKLLEDIVKAAPLKIE